MVTNLVANAVRHTPAGTPVEVAVGVEPPSQPAPGRHEPGCAVLEVRDHGPGLPPEEAGKVFQRFYRVDSSRRRGTGRGVRSRPVDRVGGDDRSRRNRRRPDHAGRGCDLPRRAAAGFPDMTPARHPGSALRELSVSAEALSSGMASNGVIRRREVTDHVLLPRARRDPRPAPWANPSTTDSQDTQGFDGATSR